MVKIVAAGCLTPLGRRLSELGDALAAGQVAVREYPHEGGQPAYAASLGEFKARDIIQKKGLVALSRASLMCAASVSLLEDPNGATLPDGAAGHLDPEQVGLVVSTAWGHLDSKLRYSREAAQKGVQLVSPILFPNTILNAPGGHTAILFGLRGPNSTIASGVRSGIEALRYASDLLASDRAERIIVVGCDEVSEPLLSGLSAQGALGRHNPATDAASLPYGSAPAGCYPGEAAVSLVLEPDGAGTDGQWGRLLGSALSRARGRTLAQAVQGACEAAMEVAGLGAADIGGIILSGNGLPSDAAEAEGLRELLAKGVPAFLPKRALGETLGAGGVLAVALALESLRRGHLPPTADANRIGLTGLSDAEQALEQASVLVVAADEGGAEAAIVSV